MTIWVVNLGTTAKWVKCLSIASLFGELFRESACDITRLISPAAFKYLIAMSYSGSCVVIDDVMYFLSCPVSNLFSFLPSHTQVLRPLMSIWPYNVGFNAQLLYEEPYRLLISSRWLLWPVEFLFFYKLKNESVNLLQSLVLKVTLVGTMMVLMAPRIYWPAAADQCVLDCNDVALSERHHRETARPPKLPNLGAGRAFIKWPFRFLATTSYSMWYKKRYLESTTRVDDNINVGQKLRKCTRWLPNKSAVVVVVAGRGQRE